MNEAITHGLETCKPKVMATPCITAAMDEDDPKLALAQRRYLMLLRQVLDEYGGLEEYGAKSKAARKLRIDQPYVSQWIHGKKRPGLKSINATMKALGIHRDFFFDPDADASDYRRFLGSRVERDEDLGHGPVEDYIAAQEAAGEPVSPKHQAGLRRIRQALGPDSMTADGVRIFHKAMIASDAHKSLDAVIAETEIEAGRGQRPLPPSRKRP